jgi:hypothetical protein
MGSCAAAGSSLRCSPTRTVRRSSSGLVGTRYFDAVV